MTVHEDGVPSKLHGRKPGYFGDGPDANDPLRPECSSPKANSGRVYICTLLDCPVHGERNKELLQGQRDGFDERDYSAVELDEMGSGEAFDPREELLTAPTTKPLAEWTIETDSGPMKIAAPSRVEAEAIAVLNGHIIHRRRENVVIQGHEGRSCSDRKDDPLRPECSMRTPVEPNKPDNCFDLNCPVHGIRNKEEEKKLSYSAGLDASSSKCRASFDAACDKLHAERGHAKCAGCGGWMLSNDACFNCCERYPTDAEEREVIDFANDVEAAMMAADSHCFDHQITDVIDKTGEVGNLSDKYGID